MNTRVTKRYLTGLAAIMTALALIAGSSLAFTKKVEAKERTATPAVKLEIDSKPIERGAKEVGSYSAVVKKVGPSVVKVVTSTKAKTISRGDMPGLDDPFLQQFFGNRFRMLPPEGNYHQPRQFGVGSGVIVTRDGYLLTNNHVVDGADQVKVYLQDGREFEGKVVGRDDKSDVAVLKIATTGLPAVEIADSDQIEVGDVVLAVGNPFGIGQTVTKGIISALDRGNMGLDYENFIQTDAAINPGNSGGALVHAEGRLIGINTMIISRSGGYQGIGLAIPSNLARVVMEGLVTDGRVVRGFLGVLIQDVTPALATEFKFKEKRGVLIGSVSPKGPADQAGLKSGDVILDFNGKTATNTRQLKLQVAETKPGTTVPVKIWREGSEKTIEVDLKELPGSEKMAKANNADNTDTGTLNGVAVSDLDRDSRMAAKVPANIKGALVTEVEEDSPSYEAGLRPGDVILEINRQKVNNASEAVKLTEDPQDKTTLLKVWSKGGSRFIVVDESHAG